MLSTTEVESPRKRCCVETDIDACPRKDSREVYEATIELPKLLPGEEIGTILVFDCIVAFEKVSADTLCVNVIEDALATENGRAVEYSWVKMAEVKYARLLTWRNERSTTLYDNDLAVAWLR